MKSVLAKPQYLLVALGLVLMGCLSAPLAQAQIRQNPTMIQTPSNGSYLGIRMEDVTAQNMANYKLSNEAGVIVKLIEKGSPAEEAKLQVNDVILKYAGTQVLSTMNMARLVRETPAGRKVDLVVSRDGKKMSFKVQIANRDDAAGMSIGPNPDQRIEPGRIYELPSPGGRTFQFRIPDGAGRGFFGNVLPDNSSDPKPRLGISLQPVTDQLAGFLGVTGKNGVLVASVEPGSPSAGKLMAGDVIIGADNKPIKNPEDLRQIVAQKDSGILNLKIIRNKSEMSVPVDLPAEDSRGQRGHRL